MTDRVVSKVPITYTDEKESIVIEHMFTANLLEYMKYKREIVDDLLKR